jgi:hypothetical protein
MYTTVKIIVEKTISGFKDCIHALIRFLIMLYNNTVLKYCMK